MDTHDTLSLKILELGREYSQIMKELGEIKQKKSLEIISLLPQCKSIKEAELKYSVTEDGQRETYLNYYSKGLIEEMRAAKQRVQVLNSQAYSQY